MCIFITLSESILGVYQFSCVDACIAIQYKCIDTNELYFYRILYYRYFTSRYISYRIVYSILIGAGYMYVYMYSYACICVFIYVYMYIYMYIYVYMPANACYYVYMIICMFSMCAHFMYADFIMFFYLWLLGQRWPNKEVQTNIIAFTKENGLWCCLLYLDDVGCTMFQYMSMRTGRIYVNKWFCMTVLVQLTSFVGNW